jgi:alanyl-tRNA synthetase
MISTNQLRATFLKYFADRGHEVVPSSPLVPANDPTLLFTNAGMVQFKDVFLGQDVRPYHRAVTSQRCVRAGGKHNDLENVGYTARHHTFFEMLGNFSFGDYFKREAIGFAWDLLTREFALPPERLWVTVFEDDDEAADIWLKEINVDQGRFSRCGVKDNFWSMGDTGPCGPCSEVFYDHGAEVPGGPPGSADEDGDRYIEIWNLVFMQFNRDAHGVLAPLPKPSVDTGLGLERLAAVMQGVHSNYAIDLFRSLVAAAAAVTEADDSDDNSLRVIADHIRASAFLIVDGVLPSNEGRGYVLRRIIRRAIRHGYKLGTREPFFFRLVDSLDAEMGEAYPELGKQRKIVADVLRREEERFAETLEQGMHMLEQAIASLAGATLPGEMIFRLYDTYGFPVDLTADVAKERRLQLDMTGFERQMHVQRETARAASQFAGEPTTVPATECRSEFVGYQRLMCAAIVSALFRGGEPVELLRSGESGQIILNETPFYPEAGGQSGDRGVLQATSARFEVRDTQRQGNAIVHVGVVREGELRIGEEVTASVDEVARQATARNHSATHLLHAGLRSVLGEHVKQKGSLVAPDRLRFDFSHFEPLSGEQRQQIEWLVNEWILVNCPVETAVMSLDEALKAGALALFGEKYDERVRVLTIGGYSTELCGGTHVDRSGDVGLFKIISETGVAAGVRRVEAITGLGALRWLAGVEQRLARVATTLKAEPSEIDERVQFTIERNRELEKELERVKAKLASQQGTDLVAKAVEVDGIKVLAATLEGADAKVLRETVDQLKARLGSAAVVLASVSGDKVRLVAGVTANGTERVQAGPLVNFVAAQVGGRGGGRPDLAQAGGNDPAALEQALGAVPGWVRSQLGV